MKPNLEYILQQTPCVLLMVSLQKVSSGPVPFLIFSPFHLKEILSNGLWEVGSPELKGPQDVCFCLLFSCMFDIITLSPSVIAFSLDVIALSQNHLLRQIVPKEYVELSMNAGILSKVVLLVKGRPSCIGQRGASKCLQQINVTHIYQDT